MCLSISREHRTAAAAERYCAVTELPPELVFLQWLIVEGRLVHPKPIPDGRWAAIRPMLFTHAIVTGAMFDTFNVDEHWCYDTSAQAEAALEAWNGYGEPTGWIRHPGSGRRVSRTIGERDADGHEIEVGAVYVRE